MLVLMLLAALWAADIMDEKNPVLFDAPSLPSRGGVRGAEVAFESLLGASAAEAEELLLCDFNAQEEGEPSKLGIALGILQAEAFLSCEARSDGSVGVGGVFTIAGAFLSGFDGGVRGVRVRELSSDKTRDRLSGDATLAAVGGSMEDGSTGASWGRPVWTEDCSS